MLVISYIAPGYITPYIYVLLHHDQPIDRITYPNLKRSL